MEIMEDIKKGDNLYLLVIKEITYDLCGQELKPEDFEKNISKKICRQFHMISKNCRSYPDYITVRGIIENEEIFKEKGVLVMKIDKRKPSYEECEKLADTYFKSFRDPTSKISIRAAGVLLYQKKENESYEVLVCKEWKKKSLRFFGGGRKVTDQNPEETAKREFNEETYHFYQNFSLEFKDSRFITDNHFLCYFVELKDRTNNDTENLNNLFEKKKKIRNKEDPRKLSRNPLF